MTITSVQSGTLSNNSSSPFSITLGAGVTLGNLVIACFEEGNNVTLSSLPAGFSIAGSFHGTASNVGAAIYWGIVGSGGLTAGTTSFSFSFTGGTGHSSGMTIREWNSSTGWQAAPVDVTAGTTGSSVTPATGSTGATAQATELVVACLAYGSTPLTESGLTAAYTQGLESTATSGPNTGREAYQVTTSAGVQACQLTLASTAQWATALAAFMPASAGGTGSPVAVFQAPYKPPAPLPPKSNLSRLIGPAVAGPAQETSPALEVYGFAIAGPGPADTINNVVVTVTEHQSTLAQGPCTFQLWDFSGTPAQIGPAQAGTASTDPANVSSAIFYGVSYSQLATLRVRVFGSAPAGSGFTESVDSVGVTVNYTPAAAAGGAPAALVVPQAAVMQAANW